MTARGTVSAFQFFCTLFVCRVIALFTFIITDRERFPPGDRMAVFLPFFLMGLLAAVPVMLVIGPKEDRTVFTLTHAISPTAAKVTAALYALGAVWSAALSTVRFELFMSTVMFSGAQMLWLIVLLLASAVWIAGRGLEAIARMSVAVAALLAVSLVYVAATTAKDFDPANLELPLQNGALPLLQNGFSAAARTGELASLLVLAPRIKGGIKKGLFFWLLVFGVTGSAIYTLILGVTGAYGERQMFQLYALTVLSKIGVIERLDSLICAIWVLCSLVRLSFHLTAGARFLEGGFRIKHRAAVYCGLAAAVLAIYAALSGRIEVFAEIVGGGVNATVFTALAIILPLLITAGYLRKKAKTKRAMRSEK